MDQNCQKCYYSWYAQMIEILFLQLYLLRFSKKSIDNFLLEADYAFLNLLKIFLSGKIAAVLNRGGINAVRIGLSRFSDSSISKITDLNSCMKVWSDNDTLSGVFEK